jgi:hypothetical protein
MVALLHASGRPIFRHHCRLRIAVPRSGQNRAAGSTRRDFLQTPLMPKRIGFAIW